MNWRRVGTKEDNNDTMKSVFHRVIEGPVVIRCHSSDTCEYVAYAQLSGFVSTDRGDHIHQGALSNLQV
jgi:hypothetical protein